MLLPAQPCAGMRLRESHTARSCTLHTAPGFVVDGFKVHTTLPAAQPAASLVCLAGA